MINDVMTVRLCMNTVILIAVHILHTHARARALKMRDVNVGEKYGIWGSSTGGQYYRSLLDVDFEFHSVR